MLVDVFKKYRTLSKIYLAWDILYFQLSSGEELASLESFLEKAYLSPYVVYVDDDTPNLPTDKLTVSKLYLPEKEI